MYEIICDDVLNWAENYDGPPFHSLISDPPYHLTTPVYNFELTGSGNFSPGRAEKRKGFLGKTWDGGDIAFRPETWKALAKHLLPGAFGIAFAGSRTYHRLACAIEDAGLILHPVVYCWGFSQGFPKATNIARQLQIRRHGRNDKTQNGKAVITNETMLNMSLRERFDIWNIERRWTGHRYGLQALKPAAELICVFQKPYEGKPLNSITRTGAGALNIDAARIGTEEFTINTWDDGSKPFGGGAGHEYTGRKQSGRWPSNFVLLHSPMCRGTKQVKGDGHHSYKQAEGGGLYKHGLKDMDDKGNPYADPDGLETIDDWECHPDCPVYKLGLQSGESKPSVRLSEDVDERQSTWSLGRSGTTLRGHEDKGTATRFFHQADWNYEVAERLAEADPVRYESKASRSEREQGLEGMKKQVVQSGIAGNMPIDTKGKKKDRFKVECVNIHATVKPINLCKHLASLLLPPAEYAPRRVLIPFAGVMSEAIACALIGFEEITAIEGEEEYCKIGEARMKHWLDKPNQERLL